jgi:hypothetical protein
MACRLCRYIGSIVYSISRLGTNMPRDPLNISSLGMGPQV